jgi:hypothetical protein
MIKVTNKDGQQELDKRQLAIGKAGQIAVSE